MNTYRILGIAAALALAAGCASFGAAKLDPGMSRAEVEKAMGKPTETIARANGDTLLYFSRLPGGRAIYKATIGADGKLKAEAEQTLTRRNIAGIKTGAQAKEVRELLGPPYKAGLKKVSVGFESVERDVWEYPWSDGEQMRLLWLQFADGALREKVDGLDFEADKSKQLN
jgi:hypothetical protein